MLDGGGEEHRAAHRGIGPAIAKLRGASPALEIARNTALRPAVLCFTGRGPAVLFVRDQERREEHGRISIQSIPSVGTGANWSVHVL